jgi:tripeptide aminopeptidase
MHSLATGIINETSLFDSFLRYVRVDTQAISGSRSFPSSPKEKDLSKLLVQELHALGVTNARMDDYGYVYASLPSNCANQTRIGFLAHIDVAPGVPGEGVEPVVHARCDGKMLTLPKGDPITVAESPVLAEYAGQTVITSDGSTLLGADDKAGVAAIMAFVQYLIKHPEQKHPTINLCFTPDEEIGAGTDHISLDALNSDFAYTVDGGTMPEVNFENFNAWGATVSITGHNHHPGEAKGRMVNAAAFASEFVSMLPDDRLPETTEHREPFIHVHTMEGSVESAKIQMILRGFDPKDNETSKKILESIAEVLRSKEPRLKLTVECKEQYRNMREMVEQKQVCLDTLVAAIESLGLKPKYKPIRGGTDGARLSFMGVPSPNIFTGGTNFHSTREFVSLEQMAMAAATMVRICETIAVGTKG